MKLASSTDCFHCCGNNRKAKRVIITFRGSLAPTEGNRDWPSNFDAFLTPMETPALLKGKFEGKLNERVMVHRGFYSKFF